MTMSGAPAMSPATMSTTIASIRSTTACPVSFPHGISGTSAIAAEMMPSATNSMPTHTSTRAQNIANRESIVPSDVQRAGTCDPQATTAVAAITISGTVKIQSRVLPRPDQGLRGILRATRTFIAALARRSQGEVGARVLARHRRDRVGYESPLKADQMPQTHRGSTRQLKPIQEAERALVANHLPWQDQVDLLVRALRRRDDLEPTSLVRQTGDLSLVADQCRAVVVGPEDSHDFIELRGVLW